MFVTDIDDRPRINPVRQRFFGDARPASTLVEISKLAIPGAKLEVIPGAAHLAAVEAPQAFNTAVRSFLTAA